MSTATKNPPSASLYVGDISSEVTEGMLFELFNNVGPVSSIRVCRDTLTRRSLGYAYVNFHNVENADEALATLNNTVISGRPCRIMWSQRDPSVRKSGLGNIFIKNLDTSIGHKDLYDTFSLFGNILSCKVAMDHQGQSKGYGFVHFEKQEHAQAAIDTVNNNMLRNKKVYVGPFIPRKVRNKQLESSWTNVYIKDIDSAIEEDELLVAFSKFGPITDRGVAVMRKDGASRGFGFVNFENHEDAIRAVQEMNGQIIGGKPVFCCRAQKKSEREEKLRKEWEAMKLNKYQGINLYIKNIEDEIDEERLRKEFSAFGNIKSCKIMTDTKGESCGFGFVCFESPEQSQDAISDMNNRILAGATKPLYVALHEPKEIRRQKLAARHNMRGRGPLAPQGQPGAPAGMYASGQPVYYPNSNVGGFVYPQQMMGPTISRSWATGQPQYQHMPYAAANQMTMVPRGGKGGNGGGRGSSSTGGRQGGRGGGARRGGGQSQSQQPQQQSQPQSGGPGMELTLANLSALPLETQKLILGERLYNMIVPTQEALAGKITGMFLESGWAIEELFGLIEDPQKLASSIEDAINVLDRARNIPQESNQSDELAPEEDKQ